MLGASGLRGRARFFVDAITGSPSDESRRLRELKHQTHSLANAHHGSFSIFGGAILSLPQNFDPNRWIVVQLNEPLLNRLQRLRNDLPWSVFESPVPLALVSSLDLRNRFTAEERVDAQ